MSSLYDRLKNKDRQTFEEVYRKNFKLIVFSAQAILHNIEESKDVAQETFVKLIQNVPPIASEEELTKYLIVSAKNLAIDLARRRDKFLQSDDSLFKDLSSEDIDAPAALKIIDRIFNRIKDKLTEKEYMVVIYHIKFKMSIQYISNIMGMSLTGVNSAYKSALRKCRKYLTKEDFYEKERPEEANPTVG